MQAGVEGVVIDMAQNQVTIKGVVEPQAICNKIMKKTKRKAKVLSPLPANEGEPIPEVVSSQVIFMGYLPTLLSLNSCHILNNKLIVRKQSVY